MMILTMLVLMNLVRVQPLIEDPTLDYRAQVRAEYLCANHQWSHIGWATSFSGLKFKYIGENLAKNFYSKTDEFNAFMASPTHKANIVNAHYQKVGFGSACNIDVILYMGS